MANADHGPVNESIPCIAWGQNTHETPFTVPGKIALKTTPLTPYMPDAAALNLHTAAREAAFTVSAEAAVRY